VQRGRQRAPDIEQGQREEQKQQAAGRPGQPPKLLGAQDEAREAEFRRKGERAMAGVLALRVRCPAPSTS
jgi:hypothetical protein